MATEAQQQRSVHVERGTGAEDLEEEAPGSANAGGGEEATPGEATSRKPVGMSTPKGGRKGQSGGDGGNPFSDPDDDYPDEDQSARTSEIERQLRQATRQVQTPKTEGATRQVGMTQIKLKSFNKGHAEYKGWKKMWFSAGAISSVRETNGNDNVSCHGRRSQRHRF